MTGTVVEFEIDTGLGVVVTDHDRYVFHCIEIADGSRDIAIGARVSFERLAKLGRYEAANIRS